MSSFRNAIITDEGKTLIAKVMTGANLYFTRLEIADNSSESLTVNIDRLLKENGAISVEGTAYSRSIVNGFWVTTLNLYAMDGRKEILFAVAKDDSPGYMPDKTYSHSATYSLDVAINSTDNITFNSVGNRIVSMDILNDILTAKSLPVKFTVDADNNITVDINDKKEGVPNYEYGSAAEWGDVTDDEIAAIVDGTGVDDDCNDGYDGYEEATEDDISSMFD